MAVNALLAGPAGKPPRKPRRKTRIIQNAFYTSARLTASADRAGQVRIDLKSADEPGDTGFLARAADAARLAVSSVASDRVDYRSALHAAFVSLLRERFEEELGRVASGYRRMLLEDVAKGDDPDVKAALNRARLQARILGTTAMVDQAQACELMGLSSSNPSATMKRKAERGEVLRFQVDGRVLYPLFQFDVDGRGLTPGLARLLADRPPFWSDFRLLHWLTRPHIDFDGPPSARLASDGEAVLEAFHREIAAVEHG